MTSPRSSPPSLDDSLHPGSYLATPPYGPSPLLDPHNDLELGGDSSTYPAARWEEESFDQLAGHTPSPTLSDDDPVTRRVDVDEDYDGHDAPVEEIIVDGFTQEHVDAYKDSSKSFELD